MALTPQFASTPKAWAANVVAAGGVTSPTAGTMTTTSRSGVSSTVPTNALLLTTAGASGTRIDEITFTSLGTSTANIGRVFIGTGTVFYLYKEIVIPLVVPTASVAVASVTTTFNNLVIASGSTVYVSVATADSNYTVTAFGGDF